MEHQSVFWQAILVRHEQKFADVPLLMEQQSVPLHYLEQQQGSQQGDYWSLVFLPCEISLSSGWLSELEFVDGARL